MRLLPTMPPPMTTVVMNGHQHPAHRLLEVLDVRAHDLGGAVAVAVDDRLEQVAVRLDRGLELVRAVDGDHPDAESEDVVPAERRGHVVVVRGAVDGAVDALVEAHEVDAAAADLLGQPPELRALLVGRPLGGAAGSLRLERLAHLGDVREVADVDAGDEHPAAREHLDELLLGEPAQRLADGSPADAEALHEPPLVDERTRRHPE